MVYFVDHCCRVLLDNWATVTPAGLTQLALGVLVTGWAIARMSR